MLHETIDSREIESYETTDSRAIVTVKWYKPIKNLLFDQKICDTTFLQIFFGSALYCHDIQEAYDKTCSKQNIEESFYKEFSLSDLSKAFKSRTFSKYNQINQILRNQLANFAISADMNIGGYLNENKLIDDKGRLERSKHAEPYKKSFIFEQYDDHPDFFIPFIATILEVMCRKNLMPKTDILIQRINEEFFKKNTIKLNTYSFENEFDNAAHYVYNFILLTMDSQYIINDDGLSRLRNENEKNVWRDLCNYASVIEYYPVSTVERFGALQMLSSAGNLYATQELYFLYLNDTVLYNSSGEKKFVLKRDLQKSEELFNKLKDSGEDFLAAFFRHNNNPKQKFVLSMLHRCQNEYEEYNEKKKEEMMDELLRIYKDKSIPFNIELLWFINKVFQKCSCIQERFESDYMMIQLKLSENPWITDVMSSAVDDNGLELHEILFILYQNRMKESTLLSICKDFTNNDVASLEKSWDIAYDKYAYWHRLNNKSETENDEFDTMSTIWRDVTEILKKAIRKAKESSTVQ